MGVIFQPDKYPMFDLLMAIYTCICAIPLSVCCAENSNFSLPPIMCLCVCVFHFAELHILVMSTSSNILTFLKPTGPATASGTKRKRNTVPPASSRPSESAAIPGGFSMLSTVACAAASRKRYGEVVQHRLAGRKQPLRNSWFKDADTGERKFINWKGQVLTGASAFLAAKAAAKKKPRKEKKAVDAADSSGNSVLQPAITCEPESDSSSSSVVCVVTD